MIPSDGGASAGVSFAALFVNGIERLFFIRPAAVARDFGSLVDLMRLNSPRLAGASATTTPFEFDAVGSAVLGTTLKDVNDSIWLLNEPQVPSGKSLLISPLPRFFSAFGDLRDSTKAVASASFISLSLLRTAGSVVFLTGGASTVTDFDLGSALTSRREERRVGRPLVLSFSSVIEAGVSTAGEGLGPHLTNDRSPPLGLGACASRFSLNLDAGASAAINLFSEMSS